MVVVLINLSKKSDGFIVSILGGSMKSCETTELSVYLIEDVSTNIKGLFGSKGAHIGQVETSKNLILTFKDNNGSELSSINVGHEVADTGDGFNLAYTKGIHYNYLGDIYHNLGISLTDHMLSSWNLAALNMKDMILTIVPARRFYTFSKVDMDSLSKAASVEAKFNN
jgi:hypothetical protein